MSKLREIMEQPSDEEIFEHRSPDSGTSPALTVPSKLYDTDTNIPVKVRPTVSSQKRTTRWPVHKVTEQIEILASSPLSILEQDAELRKLAVASGWTRGKLEKALVALRKRRKTTSQQPMLLDPIDAVVTKAALELAVGDISKIFQRDLLSLGFYATEEQSDSLLISHGARLLSCSTGFIFRGLSGSGKTELVLTGAKMLPPEMVRNLTSITERALFYIGDIKGCYVIFGEVAPTRPGDDDPKQMAWRQLISENRLTLQSVERGEDGHNIAVLHTTEGPCVIVACTTTEQSAWNDEFVNRQSWVKSDDSTESTDAVCQLIANRAAQPWAIVDAKAICQKWHAYHRALRQLTVAIPFAETIKPSLNHVSVRRLFNLILMYTKCSALLYQSQRKCVEQGGTSYLIAEKSDYERAYRLLSNNAPRVLDAVSQGAAQALETLRTAFAMGLLTQGEMRTILRQPKTTVQRWVTELVDAGLVVIDGKKGNSYRYALGVGIATSVDLGLVRPDKILEDNP